MAKFEKPTVEQLREYGREIGFRGFDAERFYDHYEMIGWVVGKGRAPMKDWRAAVRQWRRNQVEWSGAAVQETDPAILDYARQARKLIAAGGMDIGRFWAKVANAVGKDGLERVRKLAKQGGRT